MLNVGAPEVLVILLVALIILGPQRLPEAARQVGRAVGELRRISSGFQAELRDAMQPEGQVDVKQQPVMDRPVITPTDPFPEDPRIQEPGGTEPTA